MIYAHFVHQVLKIADTQGFSFYFFTFFILFSTSCGYWWEAKRSEGIGSSPGASRSTDMYHITVPLPSAAAHWNM